MTEDKPEKKIIIDEDWKAQVAAEREAAAEQKETSGPAEAASTGPLPGPSLTLLATTVATQAMVALGAVVHPATNKQEIDLPQARHFIDTLQMLQEKTEGNRTPAETATIEHLLHELRMGYIAQQQQPGTTQSP
jgi:hypothetical protein